MLKLSDCDELQIYEEKSHPHKFVTMRKVVMEVVVESYLVFPWASEGPLCILGTPRCKTFRLRLVLHTLRRLSQEWGDSVKRITSRSYGGVRELEVPQLGEAP